MLRRVAEWRCISDSVVIFIGRTLCRARLSCRCVGVAARRVAPRGGVRVALTLAGTFSVYLYRDARGLGTPRLRDHDLEHAVGVVRSDARLLRRIRQRKAPCKRTGDPFDACQAVVFTRLVGLALATGCEHSTVCSELDVLRCNARNACASQ